MLNIQNQVQKTELVHIGLGFGLDELRGRVHEALSPFIRESNKHGDIFVMSEDINVVRDKLFRTLGDQYAIRVSNSSFTDEPFLWITQKVGV